MPMRDTLPLPTERRRLAGYLDVSPYCLGMVADPRTVSAAFDAGINFFFVSADMHWPLYEPTRRGIADLLARGGDIRDRIVVAAVAYVAQRAFCHMPFKEVIDGIPGLQRLDATLAGATAAHDFPTRAAEYARHVEWGARAFGATFHDRRFAAETIASGAVHIGFVRYNPHHRGAEEDVFPRISGRTPTLVYNFNSVRSLPDAEYAALGLSSAYWRPAATDYYRFALARPEIDGILCSFAAPEEVRALVDMSHGEPLTDEERAYLCDLAALAKGEARVDPSLHGQET
jgi:hypothetical protein